LNLTPVFAAPPVEQSTKFILDPAGNALELKIADMAQLLSKWPPQVLS
jgi:extradiol dioxygenase family protein